MKEIEGSENLTLKFHCRCLVTYLCSTLNKFIRLYFSEGPPKFMKYPTFSTSFSNGLILKMFEGLVNLTLEFFAGVLLYHSEVLKTNSCV